MLTVVAGAGMMSEANLITRQPVVVEPDWIRWMAVLGRDEIVGDVG